MQLGKSRPELCVWSIWYFVLCIYTTPAWFPLFVLFHFPELQERPEAVTRLNHVQFKGNTLGEALDHYARLKAIGIMPVRSANHGPGTSFYYRDPDGNTMEISGPNFATEAEYCAYVQSDAFRHNPRGMAIDPDEFVAQFRIAACRWWSGTQARHNFLARQSTSRAWSKGEMLKAKIFSDVSWLASKLIHSSKVECVDIG